MKRQILHYKTLIFLVLAILAVFVVRTAVAAAQTMGGDPPRLNELFTLFILAGSLTVLILGYRNLHRIDWVIAFSLGAVVGATMLFATLFTPYPFFGILRGNLGQALARGFSTTLAVLGGLVIMRQCGPVKFTMADGAWKKTGQNILLGFVIGLPLAVVNVFALQMSQGQPIAWADPLAALLDALQPAIVEEVLYRFALWGLFWLILRGSLPDQSYFLAGLLATFIHAYGHLDELFVQSPLAAVGMGLVLTLIWGLPPFFLARRRGIESAIAFHWIQDVARFAAGF